MKNSMIDEHNASVVVAFACTALPALRDKYAHCMATYIFFCTACNIIIACAGLPRQN